MLSRNEPIPRRVTWLRAVLDLCAAVAVIAAVLAPAGAALAAGVYHRVAPGESLWSIGRSYATTVADIREANGLWRDTIYPGEVLWIPAGTAPTAFPATPWEKDLLARLVSAEAAGEPYLGQVAVAAVVLNRVRNPLFPDTIAGVIYQPYQFEPVLNGTIGQPATASAWRAAVAALNGADPTGGALYFYNWRLVSNAYLWSRPWRTTIGEHRFVA